MASSENLRALDDAELSLTLICGVKSVDLVYYKFSIISEFIRNGCVNLGIEPLYDGWTVLDPQVWVVSKTGHKVKHLDEMNKTLGDYDVQNYDVIFFVVIGAHE